MLDRFAGILNYKTQPGKTFADELAGRIKVIACIDKYPNIIHSDDISCSKLPNHTCSEIKALFKMRHTDAIIITWGPEEDVNTALSEIKIRAVEATQGVPNETRQHLHEGITDFERILPGPDRMYPDTDSSPVAITKERLARLSKDLPDPAYRRDARWKELGLSDELIYSLGRSRYALMFDRLLGKNLIDPKLLAYLFEGFLKNLKRRGKDLVFVTDDLLTDIFSQVNERNLTSDAIFMILEYLADNGRQFSLPEIFEKLNLRALGEDEVTGIIDEKMSSANNSNFKSEDKYIAYLVGQVKSETRGRFPSERLKELISERVKSADFARS